MLLGAALTTACQGYVYYHGMHHARNVSRDAALLVALVVGTVTFVTTLT